MEKLYENEYNCEWLSIKADVAFKTDKLSDSFKMHIRLRKDSAIWISTTYYAVEVFRFLISPDTVKFMDKKSNQYFVGDFNYLQEKFDIDLDFEALQAIILGNSIVIDEDERLKSFSRDGLYHLSSVGRTKMKKAEKENDVDEEELEINSDDSNENNPDSNRDEKEEKRKKNEKERRNKNDLAITISLFPENYKVAKISLHDFKLDKGLLVKMVKLQNLDNQLIPEKYTLDILSDNSIETTVEYLKAASNKPLKFSFSIPEKYERIN